MVIIISRLIRLNIDDDEQVENISVALSSKVRRRILRMLSEKSYTMVEIAEILNIPVTNTSFHIRALQKADLVTVTLKANSRGNAKIVSRKSDNMSINFIMKSRTDEKLMIETISIPLGSYTDVKVEPGCGIASEKGIIVSDDLPSAFFSPQRCEAQIIWFTKGYIEYRIPNYFCYDKIIKRISISLELCSEAPNFRNDWKSDITFWLNGKEVGTYLSLGDFGGKRGRLNPAWWSDFSTQYGIIKTLTVTESGTFLDEDVASGCNVKQLNLNNGDYFTLRIGIKEDAKNQGGVNLFGEKFGDYAQGLIIRIDYLSK
jgi:predicted transcriptional regulator